MNQNELFKIAFGVTDFATSNDETELERLSYLGTPVLFPIQFDGGNYNVYNRYSEIEKKSYQDFQLPFSTLTTMRRSKILKQTTTVGGASVVETYGFTPWNIDLKGVCLADPNHLTAQTAFDQHRAFVEWEKVVDSISLKGALFAVKDITNIVIKEVNFQQLKGQPNVIPFHIRAISDEPLELLLP